MLNGRINSIQRANDKNKTKKWFDSRLMEQKGIKELNIIFETIDCGNPV